MLSFFQWFTLRAFPALWIWICITSVQSVQLTSDGMALFHTNLLVQLQSDPLCLLCGAQCCVGCFTGTITGAMSARHVIRETEEWSVEDRFMRNLQMIPMICCGDYLGIPVIFSSCCSPLIVATACVDCCTYSAISALYNRCIRPSEEVRFELLEARRLLREEFVA